MTQKMYYAEHKKNLDCLLLIKRYMKTNQELDNFPTSDLQKKVINVLNNFVRRKKVKMKRKKFYDIS